MTSLPIKCNVNGKVLTRDELIRFLCEYITDNKLEGKVRNLLPQYTVLQNVRHHPVRIALELGLITREDVN